MRTIEEKINNPELMALLSRQIIRTKEDYMLFYEYADTINTDEYNGIVLTDMRMELGAFFVEIYGLGENWEEIPSEEFLMSMRFFCCLNNDTVCLECGNQVIEYLNYLPRFLKRELSLDELVNFLNYTLELPCELIEGVDYYIDSDNTIYESINSVEWEHRVNAVIKDLLIDEPNISQTIARKNAIDMLHAIHIIEADVFGLFTVVEFQCKNTISIVVPEKYNNILLKHLYEYTQNKLNL